MESNFAYFGFYAPRIQNPKQNPRSVNPQAESKICVRENLKRSSHARIPKADSTSDSTPSHTRFL
ncbi:MULTISPECIES: hypothetical protein [unclassified Helicobacter]|uniref:hypothetical protein n=1 Tax=unclassified Helicobacter TaxID=2593540 RepID=UPI00115FAB2B|nr:MULTISPECIES: hypothetical protein [unclassified Helicobacter]